MDKRTLHTIANILRRFRLLNYVDRFLYLKDLYSNRETNREFKSTHLDFPLPPPHLAFDAYGNVNWKAYLDLGFLHAEIIAEIINREVNKDSVRVLEWGCGPGRVIRHLKGLLKHKTVELYGSDYNRESIDWCKKNIEGIDFFLNNLGPPLPFKDNTFDCVYAISIFTHLSEVKHFEWVGELERVMVSGAVIIITTHGDSVSDRLLSEERRRYEEGKLVVRGNVREGKKWYLAYHPPEFVRSELLKEFKIISHSQFSHAQDIWVARKR